MSEQILEMPAVALRGITILPGMITHFDVSRAKSIQAIETAMVSDNRVFLITQKKNEDELDADGLYRVGLVAVIRQIVKLQNDIMRVLVEGEERAELLSFEDAQDFLHVKVALFEPEDMGKLTSEMQEAMHRSLTEALTEYCAVNTKIGKELARQIDGIDSLEQLIDAAANSLPLSYDKKQRILETVRLSERYELLLKILLDEINILQIKNELQLKVKEKVDQNQKEYILREQMKIIKEELGEDNASSDADQFLEALEKLKADKSVKDRIRKEIDRFRNVSQNASESTVVRGYIETLLGLPWNKKSKENSDLDNAKKILDEDHYGLEKVKERMLEFLAVRNLTKKGRSPIICLIGPPGTGKTSIAKSVARALEKEYIRISLGGVRDEAEIRGHRRTYIGAMPGRIIQGLKTAGVKNPLMLLDEIDKMSMDYRGDTASALLEVLDPEQNSRFSDHYVEIPVDLSEVLFIATANDIQSIPKPLLDRMEIIEVSSYTENEKMHIAKDFLIEKQKKLNGIKKDQLTFSEKAVEHMIQGYTREAGVRSLERKIGEICRKAAREIYQDKQESIRVTDRNLEKFLGKERYTVNMANKTDEVGIVRGLAWTSVGGVTLQIEVNIMPGKGEFRLTGQLGDVMKESAQAGISYIRSVSGKYNIGLKFFQENDIHIHIPEGAVPKDGPSAGIAMATAMLSAITGRKVRSDVAMTGEITLRGRVLPIGGLKEKLLAAKTAGIKTVCIPAKNKPDLEEVSVEIKKGLVIHLVENMEEVVGIALMLPE